jgi:hypothetical protein
MKINREPDEGVPRIPDELPSQTAESASPIAFARSVAIYYARKKPACRVPDEEISLVNPFIFGNLPLSPAKSTLQVTGKVYPDD